MRPSEKPTGAVWALLDAWARNHPLKPKQSQMAGLFGVSSSLVSQWKYCESTMQPDDMARVSEETGIPYDELAQALREDMPRLVEHSGARRSKTRPPGSMAPESD